MSQLMPLPLTVSCFRKIQIGLTFLVLAHPGRTGKRAVKRVCVCVCVMGKSLVSYFFTHSVVMLFKGNLQSAVKMEVNVLVLLITYTSLQKPLQCVDTVVCTSVRASGV